MYGLRLQVYQNDSLDLCEMQCYVAAHRHKLAIDLESELSVQVALCSLASNQIAQYVSNAQIHVVRVRDTL